MKQPVNVLFVCMGNICRSPTAHAVMRHKLLQCNLQDHIKIDSAGTHAYHVGEQADSRSRALANTKGIEIDDLRARKISITDYDDFDLILAMDSENLSLINYYAPESHPAKISPFLSFAHQIGQCTVLDVPDPYYGGSQGFEDVFDLIDKGCDALIESLLNDDDLL